ncbi:ABC transporter substrate-binding protein [Actinopolymorpha alba]|uniref:ABC transporter substrate-binding protein n=1 Tax=Actinopolymorpha alba TaxID=533267 RepID=UPI0003659472|nr:ABC transporter substrate-binding protein [Actinopolymorpha alba]
MSYPGARQLSRRRLLAAGSALGLGALGVGTAVSGCGDRAAQQQSASPSAATGWTFKDDRGTTVRTPKTPENVVAFVGTAAALHDYGIECAGVFGPTRTKDGRADVQAGDLDLNEVGIVGNTWGEFNIEKYAALEPDLLVSSMYLKDTLWYVPDESKDKILALVPSIGLQVADVSLPEPLRRHAELAKALGADLESERVAGARRRFDEASTALREAARASGGLTVMAASADPGKFYASSPDPSADLRYFKELGVNLVMPENLDARGFFETLSWENAGKYPADLIMLDNRGSALQPKDLRSQPTWTTLPAVKAGQVISWVTEPRFSYAGCAPLLESLAAAIKRARKLH